jgi:hypothetical protein
MAQLGRGRFLQDGAYLPAPYFRVDSLDELRSRILQGIDEMNAQPVRFQWKNFDSLMAK